MRPRVVCPVGASELLEAEEGACLLVDPGLAAQVVPGVLHILLDDTTWEWNRRVGSPDNPDPSVARVAISNSTEVDSPLSVLPVT